MRSFRSLPSQSTWQPGAHCPHAHPRSRTSRHRVPTRILLHTMHCTHAANGGSQPSGWTTSSKTPASATCLVHRRPVTEARAAMQQPFQRSPQQRKSLAGVQQQGGAGTSASPIAYYDGEYCQPNTMRLSARTRNRPAPIHLGRTAGDASVQVMRLSARGGMPQQHQRKPQPSFGTSPYSSHLPLAGRGLAQSRRGPGALAEMNPSELQVSGG